MQTVHSTAAYDLAAPAKLNGFLRVVGRRDDGYHLLQSLFVLLDWQDTLHLELRADGQIHRHDVGADPAPLPAVDLCVRAAQRLQAASGTSLGVDIHLDKCLPMGAGMGGGSSNAATVLLGLNRLWKLHWSREQLIALAAPLGADIPFFLGGRPAIVEGIGERLTPVAVRPRWYAVVKPPCSIETARIFSAPDLARDSPAAIVTGFLAAPSVLDELMDAPPDGTASGFAPNTLWVNDLQPVAVRMESQVQEAVDHLQAQWGNALMTGSGSAVFARETRQNAQAMAIRAEASRQLEVPVGWSGRLCRSVVTHPLWDWAH